MPPNKSPRQETKGPQVIFAKTLKLTEWALPVKAKHRHNVKKYGYGSPSAMFRDDLNFH